MISLKRRKSLIWDISKTELVQLTSSSSSISEILKYFNLENKGSNYKTLKKRLTEDGISYSHIKLGLANNRGRKFLYKRKIPLDSILVENSSYCRGSLKSRLIKEKIIEYKCNTCGNPGDWFGKKLSLQLEHKNGIGNDNRLQNLEFLCPNCHSQTITYAGKRHTKIRNKYYCNICNVQITEDSKSGMCKSCTHPTKRPSKEELLKLKETFGVCSLSRKYNVSHTSIRRWLSFYNLAGG